VSAASEPVTAGQLATELREFGVREGDLLMVHASLRKLGPVDGGAEAVIEAIDSAVGAAGSWMMILGARDDMDWVNTDHPEEERADLLAGSEPFDHLLTPANPDVGVLAEVVRTAPGTVVNDHPEARFAVRGPLADELLRDAPFHDYYGPGSPLERFLDRGGRLLRLAADPDTCTVLHHAEYLVDLPDKATVRRHRLVATADGPQVVVVACLDDEDGIVDLPGEDYFARILKEYLGSGRGSVGPIAYGTAELIDARDLVDFGVAWMARHLAG
jgi:aminoglycoside N3'-acetyltransferase